MFAVMMPYAQHHRARHDFCGDVDGADGDGGDDNDDDGS